MTRRKPTEPAERRWASYDETAAYYRTSLRSIERAVQTGRMRSYPIPGTRLRRIDLNEVDVQMTRRVA